MSEHTRVSDLLPLYISGALDRDQRLAVEAHLPTCTECREDLALWKAVAGEIVTSGQAAPAPRGLAERALDEARSVPVHPVGFSRLPIRAARRAWQLLRSQLPLVQREIWPASALVIGLGYIAALLSGRSVFVYALAPLVSAACVSMIYRPEYDPAFELSLATPTSPRQILLARLALVFGYNLALALAATLGLAPVLGIQPLQLLVGDLVLPWLAPMTFLSAAALVLSLWIGASNAISLTYLIWLVQMLIGPLHSPQAGLRLSPLILQFSSAFQHFWQDAGLLLVLSAVLLLIATWLVGRKDTRLLSPA